MAADQITRNFSMNIGDVGLGSIEFFIIWSAAIRDYNFYVISSMFNT